MKNVLYLFFAINIVFFTKINSNAQIDVIKDLAEGAGSLLSDVSASDIEAGCTAARCCWDGGFIFFDFLIEHHQEIMNLHDLDPTLLSLEISPNFAYQLHYTKEKWYTHIDYLPQIRANLGVFSADFRYNILSQYDDDSTDYFKSWELLALINIVPVETFKMSIGSGIYNELYTDRIYNANYFGMKIGLFDNRDFLNMDTRIVVDYNRGICPFVEAGIVYNAKFIDFEHLYGYIMFGGIYQNYYQAYDIWGAKGGIVFNIH